MEPSDEHQKTPVPQRPRGHLLIPDFDPAATVTLDDSPQAAFEDERDPLDLGEAAVTILSEVDGQSHHIEIARRLSRKGLQPSDPDIVATTLLILAKREVLKLDYKLMEFELLGDTRHRCMGCGRSCEGWAVGHIKDDEAKRLAQYHAELSEQYPDVARYEPFELDIKNAGDEEGRGKKAVRYLNFPMKSCVFLSEDRQCLIHRHYGSEAKPRICQQFPVVATEADEEVRIGVRPHCFRLHKTFEDGQTPNLKRLQSTDVDRRRSPVQLLDHRVATAELRTLMHRQEISVLRWLRDENMNLVELIHRLAGHGESETPRTAVTVAFVEHVVARLAPLKEKYQNQYYRHDPTHLGASMRDLFDALADLETCPPASLTELQLPARCWRYLGYAMGQVVFMRSNTGFPSVFVGAMTMALGALGASWTVRDLLASVQDDDPVPDELGERFAAWFRTFSELTVLRLFPSHEDYQALLAKL